MTEPTGHEFHPQFAWPRIVHIDGDNFELRRGFANDCSLSFQQSPSGRVQHPDRFGVLT
jgi:hypothetical protein